MEENLKEKDGHEKIISHIKDYFETTIQLLQVRATKTVSHVLSIVLFLIVVIILGMLTLGLFTLTLASWMADLLQDRTQGYLAAAGILLVILISFIILFKKLSIIIFRNRIIRKIYEKQDKKS